MSTLRRLTTRFLLLASATLLVPISCAHAQENKEPDPGARAAPAADASEEYILRAYDVGDLTIIVHDYPYSDQLHAAPAGSGAGGGFGGGGGGGGGGGIFSVPADAAHSPKLRHSTGGKNRPIVLTQFGSGGRTNSDTPPVMSAPAMAPSAITMDDLERVLVQTADPDSWDDNGGNGKIEPLGTTFVIWQTQGVHKRIEHLLKQIRQTLGDRKTVTVDARWLLLNSDELDKLVPAGNDRPPQVDRQALAEFSRKPGSIRGLTTCFSGQLVYVVSGTRRNFVGGYIPVVGAIDNAGRVPALASSQNDHWIQLAQFVDGGTSVATRAGSVGYQPIIVNPNFGAVLEIRPTLLRVDNTTIVDLRTTLTAPGQNTPEVVHGPGSNEVAPSVERVAIDSHELATTLRMPLSKPVLVGGLTYVPSSPASALSTSEPVEQPQLYLVLEIR